MHQRLFFLFLILTVFLFAPVVSGQSLEEKVISYTLPNGMKFLLVQRKGAPVFAGYIRVKVGGADEKEGKTGIAHMLEHMAFKGTRRIGTRNYAAEKKLLDEIEKVGIRLAELTRSGQAASPEAKDLMDRLMKLQKAADAFVVKEEFSRAIQRNGGSSFNATTSKDLTSYFVELPSGKLELWAYLESERLKDPVFREFYMEREVVREERRTRVEGSPFGKSYEELLETAFQKSPYKVPTIGYDKDLTTLTATDLEKFYKTYYVPQNMVGAVVGDIDLEETKKILNKYFGTLPRGLGPPSLTEDEPPQTEERRNKVAFEARPQLMMAFHKPTLPARDDYVFDLIGQVLCEGRTSRLYQALVEKYKIAQTVDCDTGTPGGRLSNLFFIYASSLGNNGTDRLEKVIESELERLKTEPVSAEELKRAEHQILSDRLFKIKTNLGLAETLTYFETIAGDWRYLTEHEKVLKTITPQEIQAVARKYLVKNNRTVSVLEPAKK